MIRSAMQSRHEWNKGADHQEFYASPPDNLQSKLDPTTCRNATRWSWQCWNRKALKYKVSKTYPQVWSWTYQPSWNWRCFSAASLSTWELVKASAHSQSTAMPNVPPWVGCQHHLFVRRDWTSLHEIFDQLKCLFQWLFFPSIQQVGISGTSQRS